MPCLLLLVSAGVPIFSFSSKLDEVVGWQWTELCFTLFPMGCLEIKVSRNHLRNAQTNLLRNAQGMFKSFSSPRFSMYLISDGHL